MNIQLEKYEMPPKGQRGHFKRMGIPMDPMMIKELKLASIHLNTDVSTLVRYAVNIYLNSLKNT